MAINETAQTIKKNEGFSTAAQVDYTSLEINRGYEVDVLSQFKANMNQIEDLTSRLRFVMNEVTSLMDKRFKS